MLRHITRRIAHIAAAAAVVAAVAAQVVPSADTQAVEIARRRLPPCVYCG